VSRADAPVSLASFLRPAGKVPSPTIGRLPVGSPKIPNNPVRALRPPRGLAGAAGTAGEGSGAGGARFDGGVGGTRPPGFSGVVASICGRGQYRKD
jgi:hypothetical protein